MSRVRGGTQFLFKKHLLMTNLAISAGLSATGDSIQQHYEKIKDPERNYNFRRTLNMSTAGVTIGGVCHFWYLWLDRFLPGRTFSIALKKMLLDQIICSPVTIGTFFVTLAVVEKSSADEFLEELRSKSWRLYLAEWVIWPPAQMINFFFLPLRYRVLYDNTISLGYDVYTSYVKHEIPSSSSIEDMPSSIAVRATSLNNPSSSSKSPSSTESSATLDSALINDHNESKPSAL